MRPPFMVGLLAILLVVPAAWADDEPPSIASLACPRDVVVGDPVVCEVGVASARPFALEFFPDWTPVPIRVPEDGWISSSPVALAHDFPVVGLHNVVVRARDDSDAVGEIRQRGVYVHDPSGADDCGSGRDLTTDGEAYDLVAPWRCGAALQAYDVEDNYAFDIAAGDSLYLQVESVESPYAVTACLRGPSGTSADCRSSTHFAEFRIESPLPGTWSLEVRHPSISRALSYNVSFASSVTRFAGVALVGSAASLAPIVDDTLGEHPVGIGAEGAWLDIPLGTGRESLEVTMHVIGETPFGTLSGTAWGFGHVDEYDADGTFLGTERCPGGPFGGPSPRNPWCRVLPGATRIFVVHEWPEPTTFDVALFRG